MTEGNEDETEIEELERRCRADGAGYSPQDPQAVFSRREDGEDSTERHFRTVVETGLLGQIEINKVEAASRSVFVAGWRPFIGWSCGAAMVYSYVAQPILAFALAQSGHLVDLPRVELGEMMPVLLGMLGLGGMRSFEKLKGVSK